MNTYALHGRNTVAEPTLTNSFSGGLVHQIDKWSQLDRFLILGTEGNHYYTTEQKMTELNCKSLLACLSEDGVKLVDRIVEISEAGRAFKNSPALFALAVAISKGDISTRKAAKLALPKVARTGTWLFEFVDYALAIRGWGRALKSSVKNWYDSKTTDQLAFQMMKYQSRVVQEGKPGWSQRDLLRLVHPKVEPFDPKRQGLFNYVVTGELNMKLDHPNIVEAMHLGKTAGKEQVIDLIRDYDLSREMIPTTLAADLDVQKALFRKMGLTALIRNLGNYTASGLLAPFSEEVRETVRRLTDAEYVRKSRIHPLQALVASRQYTSGGGLRSSKKWMPVSQISAALERTFELSFANAEPTGKNFGIFVDISGSMSSKIETTGISSCEVAAVLAMIVAKKEQNYFIGGFAGSGSFRREAHNSIKNLGITHLDTLASASKKALDNNWGSTNCSMPFVYAEANKLPIDVFVVITDNDTNSGGRPDQALWNYRKSMNKPDAKLVVLATSPSPFTIANPNDPGMLDISGFDSNILSIISDFAKS